jgi:tripartite-type tricarboxylate transporter receptor subunit TctC
MEEQIMLKTGARPLLIPLPTTSLISSLTALLCAALLAGSAAAQSWPSKPVRFIVSTPAGTSPDLVGRMAAERLGKVYGQPFVVENITGAGGLLATQTLVRAAPDGHTLMFAGMGALVIDPYMHKNPGYDADRDLVPIAMIYEQDRLSVAVHPDVPAKTLPELIAHAKANPGKLSYGVTNVVLLIMVGQWINKLAGTDMVGVTYKTAGQQMQDLITGRIHWIVAAPPQLEPFVKAGKVRIVAVDGVGRYPKWPDVASIAETFPGYRTSGTGILAGPRGIPQNIVQSLNGAMDKINKDPEYQARLLEMSFQIREAGTPESINAFIRERRQYWGTIFRELKIQPE